MFSIFFFKKEKDLKDILKEIAREGRNPASAASYMVCKLSANVVVRQFIRAGAQCTLRVSFSNNNLWV